LPVNSQAHIDAPIIELDTIDSTNNYAMHLVDADTAQPGLTVVSAVQTGGKGQRGRVWQAAPGESLLMSIVSTPNYTLEQQFPFSATVAVAIAKALQNMYEGWQVAVKWPNDIIVDDKKAGGILIENIIRGQKWCYAIIGLGLNIRQKQFPAELPLATSLSIASQGKDHKVNEVRDILRKSILEHIAQPADATGVMAEYNSWLYKKDEWQGFTQNDSSWDALVQQVTPDGNLHVALPGGETDAYTHGTVNWKW
jgi:BirA family biotin operon repressor/biotin-[acetyl-CoA-carboxylase] ligase